MVTVHDFIVKMKEFEKQAYQNAIPLPSNIERYSRSTFRIQPLLVVSEKRPARKIRYSRNEPDTGGNILYALLRNDESEISDKELLDLLAFLATNNKLSNKTSDALLTIFGGIRGVVNAHNNELRGVVGDSPKFIAMLSAIRETLRRSISDEKLENITISGSKILDQYLGIGMKSSRVEMLRVLFVNQKNQLIKDEVMFRGTVAHTPFYHREVAKRALELFSSGVILVHNHPSGDTFPSSVDIKMTRSLQECLKFMDIRLLDHLILGRSGTYSFVAHGLLSHSPSLVPSQSRSDSVQNF